MISNKDQICNYLVHYWRQLKTERRRWRRTRCPTARTRAQMLMGLLNIEMDNLHKELVLYRKDKTKE